MSKTASKHDRQCPMTCIKHQSTIDICPPRHLLHAAILYILMLGALWFIPTYLYQRISETGQAVVLTLVDSAVAELQSLAEPKISNSQQQNTQAAVKNDSTVAPSPALSTSTTTSSESFATIKPEEVENKVFQADTLTYTQVEGSTEPLAEVNESGGIVVEESKGDQQQKVTVDEGDVAMAPSPEVSAKVGVDEEIHITSSEVTKMDEIMTAAPELNDSAARAQLIADESNGVIFDSLVTAGPTDPHEDIPSFSEWTQKRLEEAEKKKSHPNVSVQNPGGPGRSMGSMKIRLKNYASPDCGAKVVAANPEARSPRSVLVATKDEYMLNTCTSRIWFVVELCEAIQAKKIELANFELFSSSPKDFTVYVSDRYPTRDWSSVGQFAARDEKDIQSFNLHPRLFGKFVKVELQSHYGSEHFCPISLFRVYGTSEFEVLETETQNHVHESNQDNHENEDDDDDESNNDEEINDYEAGAAHRNLFGTATDAVINIVKKATEVLVKSGNSGNNGTMKKENVSSTISEDFGHSCGSLRYSVFCKSCTNQTFLQVVKLLTCQSKALEKLLNNSQIEWILRNTNVCFPQQNSSANQHNLVSLFFPNYYIIGLCNMMAIKNRKVNLSSSHEINKINTSSVHKEDVQMTSQKKEDVEPTLHIQTVPTRQPEIVPVSKIVTLEPKPEMTTVESKSPLVFVSETVINNEAAAVASQIKPTKISHKEELKKETTELPMVEDKFKEVKEDVHQHEMLSTPAITGSVGSSSTIRSSEESATIVGTTETLTVQTVVVENADVPVESQDNPMPEAKLKLAETKGEADQGKLYFGEQDGKILMQEQNTFDSILSDLKELEGDGLNIGNGHANKETMASQPATSTNSPQLKESVFLRLSNRIKALERNMSLSSQYLEELSRRYKRQVEEMQRSLERAVIAMSEESRKTEERDAKRLEEIASLRNEISILTKSIESLTADRSSWRFVFSTFSQHVVFIVFDVFIILLIFYYCRRTEDLDDDYDDDRLPILQKQANNQSQKNSHITQLIPSKRINSKKQKKRRPSEVTASISGTYQELLIEEEKNNFSTESKDKKDKERKKKRKKHEDTKSEVVKYKSMSAMPGGATLPLRRVSSNDAPEIGQQHDEKTLKKRPDSAPSAASSGWYGDAMRIQILAEKQQEDKSEQLNESDLSTKSIKDDDDEDLKKKSNLKTSSAGGSGIVKQSRFSSPLFMRTALRSRSKRMSFKSDAAEDQLELESSLTNESANGSANGHIDESDDSIKKAKKSAGLKKMVRKFF